MTALAHQLTHSEREWLDVRAYMREHRPDLTAAASGAMPAMMKVSSTHLLTRPEWLPDRPLPLHEIGLDLEPDQRFGNSAALLSAGRHILPARADGPDFNSYAEALGALAAPAVFENRPTYRLLGADLTASRPYLRFGRGDYFDSINTGEAAAHEFAAARLGLIDNCILRDAIGDPRDPDRRPINLAVSTLTIRHERADDRATCLLHWRDPSKVGHAGGMYQVVPVGIFQPSGHAAWNQRNDFSLWHSIVRELSEELLGTDEDYDSERQPIDYEAWPFARRLSQAVAEGGLAAYCLGMGVDPLTYATDLLTAVVIDAETYDELLDGVRTDNTEGQVLQDVPFEREQLRALTSRHPFQPAGEALLELALRHRIAHN